MNIDKETIRAKYKATFIKQSVSIDGRGLTKIPEEIFLLPNIKSVTIQKTQAIEFPTNFSENTSITELNIEYNKIVALPDNIHELFPNLSSLKAAHNKITRVPEEIQQIKLVTLDLSYNKVKSFPKLPSSLIHLKLSNNLIKFLPKEISFLQKLQDLECASNRFTSFPEEIASLKQLRLINFDNNKIAEIPESISSLTELFYLSLASNKITSIPRALMNLKKLDRLILSDNPLESPYDSLVKEGLLAIMRFFWVPTMFNNTENSKGKNNIEFDVPLKIRTAFKQYIMYFQDYAKNFKDIEIELKVENRESKVELIFSEDIDENIISDLLGEYLNFIGTHIESIRPNFTSETNNEIKEFHLLELKQQVTHLQMQLQFKEYEVKVLERQLGDWKDNNNKLLDIQFEKSKNPTPLLIQTTAIASPTQTNTNQIQIDIHNELPQLQKELLELMSSLPDLPTIEAKELEKLDDELLSADIENDPKKELKKPATRLKRLLDAINEEDSTLNKAVKAGDKTIKGAQKLAKTYNKIAEWLGMPQVPKVFLGKNL